MRYLCICFFVLFASASPLLAQEVQAENIPKKPVEETSGIENPNNEDMFHRYICRRCGTENQIDWSLTASDKELDLIPHCHFCGKKYWPKFKPSGFLQRTFSSLGSLRTDSN
jgi:DNA-directed RNA polymerase subunit RPC12/RpoP